MLEGWSSPPSLAHARHDPPSPHTGRMASVRMPGPQPPPHPQVQRLTEDMETASRDSGFWREQCKRKEEEAARLRAEVVEKEQEVKRLNDLLKVLPPPPPQSFA